MSYGDYFTWLEINWNIDCVNEKCTITRHLFAVSSHVGAIIDDFFGNKL
jgi:hypothetical protein